MIECDALWMAIASAFFPFLPSFLPLELLGVSPSPSASQFYGIFLAFHLYHSQRDVDSISLDKSVRLIRVLMRGCGVAKHLYAVAAGKSKLRLTNNTAPGSSSDTTLVSSSLWNESELRSTNLNHRLSFSHARRVVYQARKLDWPAGPLLPHAAGAVHGGCC